MNNSDHEIHFIPQRDARLMAARIQIRMSQGDMEEFVNPNTPPDRKKELQTQLMEDLFEPFEELGYMFGREGDDRAIDLLSDILMEKVDYTPSKGKFQPFVERLIRNKGVDDHRRRTSRQAKAEEAFDYKLAEVTYANNLLEFSEGFPLVETIEEEIPNLRLEADREIVMVLLDHLKQHGEIPSNLHISKVTGYGTAHVSTRLKETRKRLRTVILAKAERMEGVDIDALHLSF